MEVDERIDRGSAVEHPQFKGTVATAETRRLLAAREQFGGSNLGIHWNSNGESYWLMVEAMGREMGNCWMRSDAKL